MIIIIGHCSQKLSIIYDKDTDEIIYKDNHVSFKKLKEAYDSGLDQVKLADKLIFRNRSGICRFGCLVLTEENVQQLIKKVWEIQKMAV